MKMSWNLTLKNWRARNGLWEMGGLVVCPAKEHFKWDRQTHQDKSRKTLRMWPQTFLTKKKAESFITVTVTTQLSVSNESLLPRHTGGKTDTTVTTQTFRVITLTKPVGQNVFKGATEDTNRQIQQVTVAGSICLSVCLFVRLSAVCSDLHPAVDHCVRLSSLSLFTLFSLILFSVCRRVCRSLSITPVLPLCVCMIFLNSSPVVFFCLTLCPLLLTSPLSYLPPVSLSVCLFQSVCLSVYLDLFWLISSPSILCCCVCVCHMHT